MVNHLRKAADRLEKATSKGSRWTADLGGCLAAALEDEDSSASDPQPSPSTQEQEIGARGSVHGTSAPKNQPMQTPSPQEIGARQGGARRIPVERGRHRRPNALPERMAHDKSAHDRKANPRPQMKRRSSAVQRRTANRRTRESLSLRTAQSRPAVCFGARRSGTGRIGTTSNSRTPHPHHAGLREITFRCAICPRSTWRSREHSH